MLKVGFSEFDITPPVGKLIPGSFTPHYTTEPARGNLLVTAAAFEVDGNPLIYREELPAPRLRENRL